MINSAEINGVPGHINKRERLEVETVGGFQPKGLFIEGDRTGFVDDAEDFGEDLLFVDRVTTASTIGEVIVKADFIGAHGDWRAAHVGAAGHRLHYLPTPHAKPKQQERPEDPAFAKAARRARVGRHRVRVVVRRCRRGVRP